MRGAHCIIAIMAMLCARMWRTYSRAKRIPEKRDPGVEVLCTYSSRQLGQRGFKFRLYCGPDKRFQASRGRRVASRVRSPLVIPAVTTSRGVPICIEELLIYFEGVCWNLKPIVHTHVREWWCIRVAASTPTAPEEHTLATFHTFKCSMSKREPAIGEQVARKIVDLLRYKPTLATSTSTTRRWTFCAESVWSISKVERHARQRSTPRFLRPWLRWSWRSR